MSLQYWIYLVVGLPVLVTPLVGVVENVQVLAQEQEQQNTSSSNATTGTSTT